MTFTLISRQSRIIGHVFDTVLTEKLSELDNRTYREMPKTNLKDFADLWIKSYVEGNLKPSTIRGYRDTVAKLVKPYGDLIS